MNAERRKRLADAIENLKEAHATITEVMDSEQEAFDNMPESFQNGDKGTEMTEMIETMSGYLDEIDNAVSGLEAM